MKRKLCENCLSREAEKQVMEVADGIRRRRIQDHNSDTDDCITSTAIASGMGISHFDLLEVLEEMGVVVYWNRHYHLAPQYEGQGLAKTRSFYFYTRKGVLRMSEHLVWTQKGVSFLEKQLKFNFKNNKRNEKKHLLQ